MAVRAAQMEACLTQDRVLELIEGRLGRDEAARVDEHMDGCPACRALVAAIVRNTSGTAGRADTAAAAPDTEGTESAKELLTGQLLAGRFRIVRRIGRGAMGIVYEAQDLELQVRVALKVLADSAGPLEPERLRREVVLGRRVTHPNICRLHDFGTSDGLAFLSMEYVPGEPLSRLMARRRLTPDEAVALLGQILDALQAAHAHGVVHRDVKPSNIMVAADGHLRVMDFGLADELGAVASEGARAVGTPTYWSPEQARGERATVRSDLFSFGVIACELLGGQRPGRDVDRASAAVPPRYRALVRRCLASSPDRRPASAAEVRRLLVGGRDDAGWRRRAKRRLVTWSATLSSMGAAALRSASKREGAGARGARRRLMRLFARAQLYQEHRPSTHPQPASAGAPQSQVVKPPPSSGL